MSDEQQKETTASQSSVCLPRPNPETTAMLGAERAARAGETDALVRDIDFVPTPLAGNEIGENTSLGINGMVLSDGLFDEVRYFGVKCGLHWQGHSTQDTAERWPPKSPKPGVSVETAEERNG